MAVSCLAELPVVNATISFACCCKRTFDYPIFASSQEKKEKKERNWILFYSDKKSDLNSKYIIGSVPDPDTIFKGSIRIIHRTWLCSGPNPFTTLVRLLLPMTLNEHVPNGLCFCRIQLYLSYRFVDWRGSKTDQLGVVLKFCQTLQVGVNNRWIGPG